MGAELVGHVLMNWANLNDRAFRVLVRMAHIALDKEKDGKPPKMYFGGEELLMLTLRNERGGNDDTRRATVRRAVRDLIAAGAIERVRRGVAGKRAEFRLTLDRVGPYIPDASPRNGDRKPSEEPQGDTSSHPQGDTGSQAQGDTWCPPRVTPGVTPRSHKEPQEELHKEEVVSLRTDLTVTRAREAVPEKSDHPHKSNTPTPQPTRPPINQHVRSGGFGFCMPCHNQGHTVVAVDPYKGSACRKHLHTPARTQEIPV